MRRENLYGENVSTKIVDATLEILDHEGKLFRFDHERLGLEKYFESGI
jgi:hypothetical protein